VTDVAEHLLLHLETAARMYGGDLLLPVTPRPASAPPTRAKATAAPAPVRPAVAPSPPPVAARAKAPPAAPARPAPAPVAAAAGDSTPAGVPAGGSLAELRTEVLACRRCKLCEGRKTVVFGEGNPTPPVLFVGEAPGAVEDRTGRPFVGPAGQLLDRILENAMGLRREDVFIANINKCRPPGNRDPEPDEVAACRGFLERQIDLVRPRVICALGRIAAQTLLGVDTPIGRLRGQWTTVRGVPTMITYHPAALLRNPALKRPTWDDLQLVQGRLREPAV